MTPVSPSFPLKFPPFEESLSISTTTPERRMLLIAVFVFSPLQLLIQLTLPLVTVERSFLLPLRLSKRLRRAFGSYGPKWKQSRNIQACGYANCCCGASVVDIWADLVTLGWHCWAVICKAKSLEGEEHIFKAFAHNGSTLSIGVDWD